MSETPTNTAPSPEQRVAETEDAEFRLVNSSIDASGYDIVGSDGERVAWARGEYAIVAVRALNRYIDGDDDDALRAELDRLHRGITAAHAHLAENLDRSNTDWLLDYLEALAASTPRYEPEATGE